MGTVTESRDGGDGATTLGPFVDDESVDEQASSPTPKNATASRAINRCQVLIGIAFVVGIERTAYCRTFEAFAAAIK